jgi:hypothetical protein
MQNMLEIVNLICVVTSLLFLWFKTDAFISYCELLGVFKTCIKSYYHTVNLSFPQFLFSMYRNHNKPLFRFVIKLITCPVCLGLWLSVAVCVFSSCLPLTFLVYITSLLFYFILERVML